MTSCPFSYYTRWYIVSTSNKMSSRKCKDVNNKTFFSHPLYNDFSIKYHSRDGIKSMWDHKCASVNLFKMRNIQFMSKGIFSAACRVFDSRVVAKEIGKQQLRTFHEKYRNLIQIICYQTHSYATLLCDRPSFWLEIEIKGVYRLDMTWM